MTLVNRPNSGGRIPDIFAHGPLRNSIFSCREWSIILDQKLSFGLSDGYKMEVRTVLKKDNYEIELRLEYHH